MLPPHSSNNPGSILTSDALCVEFSLCFCDVGFLWVLQFPKEGQLNGLIGHGELWMGDWRISGD